MPFETSEISFGTSIQNWNLGHYKRTEAYASAIDRLYQTAIADFSRLATRTKINPKKAFSFDDYPTAKREAAKIVSGLTEKMKAVVEVGSREEWLYANKKADSFLKSILDTSKLDKKRLSGYQDRNLNALKAFQKRKVNGMNLSQRVWKYTDQFKQTMELGIDVGLGEGRSAQELARDLKSNLLEPDKLFRRVRDKRGNLQLSKAAKAFHPGQGVYRSSYKNAMRLARSEINMAYRTSDNLRWGQLDFVVGFEVKLSNNHTLNGKPFRDICDDLAGKYPKTFKFNGWHPQCRCYSVPILMDPDEFNADELNELKSALNGKEYRKYVSKNTVRDVPNNFKTWARDNQKKIDGYKSTPYFVKDNFRYGKIRNGLKLDAGPVKPSTQAKIPFSSPSPKQTIQKNQGKDRVYDQITKVEDNIRMNKDFETAYAVDKNGKVLLDKRGQATSVSITREEKALLKDSIFTHNHPRGWKKPANSMGRIGNSFSTADILVAIENDIAEIRAVTPNFTFIMRRPKNGWGLTVEEAAVEMNKVERVIETDLRERIYRNTTTVAKASVVHYHRLWTEFSKKFGIEYSKSKTR